MLNKLFGGRKLDRQAHAVYKMIVDRAREERFYTAPFGVEDSVEGRFEMILLHLFMADQFLSRLDNTVPLRRAIRELLVTDMDRSLREMGIGDMSVGKQMKQVGAALLGRVSAYEHALVGSDEADIKQKFADILQRNTNFLDENGANTVAAYAYSGLQELNSRDTKAWSVESPIFVG